MSVFWGLAHVIALDKIFFGSHLHLIQFGLLGVFVIAAISHLFDLIWQANLCHIISKTRFPGLFLHGAVRQLFFQDIILRRHKNRSVITVPILLGDLVVYALARGYKISLCRCPKRTHHVLVQILGGFSASILIHRKTPLFRRFTLQLLHMFWGDYCRIKTELRRLLLGLGLVAIVTRVRCHVDTVLLLALGISWFHL